MTWSPVTWPRKKSRKARQRERMTRTMVWAEAERMSPSLDAMSRRVRVLQRMMAEVEDDGWAIAAYYRRPTFGTAQSGDGKEIRTEGLTERAR